MNDDKARELLHDRLMKPVDVAPVRLESDSESESDFGAAPRSLGCIAHSFKMATKAPLR